jgi:hypothetical protein
MSNEPTANELADKLEVIAKAMRERKFAGHAFCTPWQLRDQITDSAALLRTQAAEIRRLNETQAVCHCGLLVKDHDYETHQIVPMDEGPCPNE